MLEKFNNAFGIDGKMNIFLSRITDLVMLNAVWFVCSIPIITIGPAFAALNSALLKYDNHEEYSPVKYFLGAFKKNAKKTMPVTGMLTFLTMIYLAALYIAYRADFQGFFIMLVFSVIVLVNILIAGIYFCLLSDRTDMGRLKTLKTAYTIGIMHLPYTILMIALSVAPLLLFLYNTELFLRLIFIWMIGGVALIQLACVRLYRKAVAKQRAKGWEK
jgi:uncharacterized membrane protein YesL